MEVIIVAGVKADIEMDVVRMKKIILGILGAIADILTIIEIIAALYTENNVKVFGYILLGMAVFFLIGVILWIATLIEKEIKIQKNLKKMRAEEKKQKFSGSEEF